MFITCDLDENMVGKKIWDNQYVTIVTYIRIHDPSSSGKNTQESSESVPFDLVIDGN